MKAIPAPGQQVYIRNFPMTAFQSGYAAQPLHQAEGKGETTARHELAVTL